jgi:hypothetical protein
MTLMPPDMIHDESGPDMAEARSLLPTAEALAVECFQDVRNKQVTCESDPETAEHWIELRLTVSGTPEDVATAYDVYVARWVAVVPWPRHNWVRLCYVIA